MTLTYTVTATDGSLTTEQSITITITGTNDAPVVGAIGQTDLNEQTDTSLLTANIPVTFSDVDLNDVGHTATVTGVVVTGAGASGLTLSESDLVALVTPGLVAKAAGSANGAVDLAFSADSTVFDYLAAGETVTLTYTIAINDGDGGIDPADIRGAGHRHQRCARSGSGHAVCDRRHGGHLHGGAAFGQRHRRRHRTPTFPLPR